MLYDSENYQINNDSLLFFQDTQDIARWQRYRMAPQSSMEAGHAAVNLEVLRALASFRLHSKAATIPCSSTLSDDAWNGIPVPGWLPMPPLDMAGSVVDYHGHRPPAKKATTLLTRLAARWPRSGVRPTAVLRGLRMATTPRWTPLHQCTPHLTADRLWPPNGPQIMVWI